MFFYLKKFKNSKIFRMITFIVLTFILTVFFKSLENSKKIQTFSEISTISFYKKKKLADLFIRQSFFSLIY